MNKPLLQILMVEDNPLDAELNQEQLKLLEEYECNVKLVSNKEQYLEAIESYTPDLVLCDYNLPQYNGMEALKDLNKTTNLIPFIFVTGTLQEEFAADAIKSGAWDYVVKDRLFRLPLAIRSVLQVRDERKTAALAKEKTNNILMAIDQTSTQVIMLDKHLKIEYVNKKFLEVTGLTQDEVLGQSAEMLKDREINIMGNGVVESDLKNGKVFHGEVLSRNKNEEKYWELISITPIKDEAKEIYNYIVIKEDITLQKRMELDLIEARDKAEQSNKLKEAFLHNMSHEIRTPLNAIVGFSDLLHTPNELEPKTVTHYTGIIRDSSDQLLSIFNDVLTAASIQTGEESINFASFDLNDLFDQLNSIFYPIAQKKKVQLFFEKAVAGKEFLIETDRSKLTQILSNFINNAIKYTENGSVTVLYSVEAESVNISVKDTGIGIDKKDQELIFERFRQASEEIHINYGGTGLGLSISKSFAEMLGGFIKVDSALNEGTTFTLSLPFTSNKIKKEDGAISETTEIDSYLKILIAEDEYNNYLLLESLLEKPNIIVLHASDGQEAIDMCGKYSDIDLILMDIKMPNKDGVTALREIKEMNPEIPIIAQSAYVMNEDIKRCLDAGFSEYITKPIHKKELYHKINTVLGKKIQ